MSHIITKDKTQFKSNYYIKLNAYKILHLKRIHYQTLLNENIKLHANYKRHT